MNFIDCREELKCSYSMFYLIKLNYHNIKYNFIYLVLCICNILYETFLFLFILHYMKTVMDIFVLLSGKIKMFRILKKISYYVFCNCKGVSSSILKLYL